MIAQMKDRSFLVMNSFIVDDWTAKRAIIASNVNSVCVDDWIAE